MIQADPRAMTDGWRAAAVAVAGAPGGVAAAGDLTARIVGLDGGPGAD
jgi:hypothetical protein